MEFPKIPPNERVSDPMHRNYSFKTAFAIIFTLLAGCDSKLFFTKQLRHRELCRELPAMSIVVNACSSGSRLSRLFANAGLIEKELQDDY